MFASEFVSGLIVFLYQKKFVKKTLFKAENQDKYMNIELISVRKVDSIKKMIFLLFCCVYFDFIQFILSIYTKVISSFTSFYPFSQLI